MNNRVKQHPSEVRFQTLGVMPEHPDPTPPFSFTTTVCVYAATDCVSAHRRHAGDRSTTDLAGVPYYGYRYYNPGLGRWISRDPIGEWGSLNFYTSCKNRLINRYDYLGLVFGPLDCITLLDLIGKAGKILPWIGSALSLKQCGDEPRIVKPAPPPKMRYIPIGDERPETFEEPPSGTCDRNKDFPRIFYTSCTEWEDVIPVSGTVDPYNHEEESTCYYSDCDCTCRVNDDFSVSWKWECEEKTITFRRRVTNEPPELRKIGI